MLQKPLIALSLLAALATSASARQAASAGQKPAETTAAPVARTTVQLVNIKLELTIADQRDGVATAPKNVTLLVADRGNGRIRTNARGSELVLNVDAVPEIVREGRVRVHLTLEYRPASASAEKDQLMTVTESLTVIAEDGKSVLISQSADPASNRVVKVELKATVLK